MDFEITGPSASALRVELPALDDWVPNRHVVEAEKKVALEASHDDHMHTRDKATRALLPYRDCNGAKALRY